MVVAWTYAVAVNFVPVYTITVDKVGESTVGLEESPSPKDEEAMNIDATEKKSTVHVE